MNRALFRVFCCMLIIIGVGNGISVPLLSAGYEQTRLRVAIIEFEIKGDIDIRDAGTMVAEMLITELGKTKEFDLKERILLQKVLREQSLSASGVIDEGTAVRIGQLYGVESIITGSVMKWGKTIRVNARLVDTQSGSIIDTYNVEATDINEVPIKMASLSRQVSEKVVQSQIGSSVDSIGDRTKKAQQEAMLHEAGLKAEQEAKLRAEKEAKLKSESQSPKAVAEEKQLSSRLPAPVASSASGQGEFYSGTWVLRTSHNSLRELNYSKLVLKQNGKQVIGIHYLPNGGKVKVDGTVDGETLKLSFYYKDDKSLETGLMMHGVEQIRSNDVANTRAGIGRSQMKALAEISGNGIMLEGVYQMWYADMRPSSSPWAASVSNVNIYDAGTPTAQEKRPPVPVKLIFMEK